MVDKTQRDYPHPLRVTAQPILCWALVAAVMGGGITKE